MTNLRYYNSNYTRIIEIIAVIITGFGKFLFVDYLHLKFWYIITACILWIGYIVHRIRKNKSILAYWGFRQEGFKESLRVVVPISVLAVTGFIIYGLSNDTLILNWHIIPVLILYPLWGTIQQFLIIGLIARNMSDMEGARISNRVIIIVASITFAVVHYPSWLLIGGTFGLAIFYTILYLKYRNLWVLGLFHGWLGGLFYFFVLERDPWVEFIEAVG